MVVITAVKGKRGKEREDVVKRKTSSDPSGKVIRKKDKDGTRTNHHLDNVIRKTTGQNCLSRKAKKRKIRKSKP